MINMMTLLKNEINLTEISCDKMTIAKKNKMQTH